VDFSGGARAWRAFQSRPTVWLAFVEDNGSEPRLEKLIPVQSLPGAGEPFERLVKLLAAGQFGAAAIDAPFAIPAVHMPRGGHSELLREVQSLPNGPDRPFPMGRSIVELGETVAPKTTSKPLRATETFWARKGVNTRSTMWSGPRGGAAFAAACLRLLGRSERPCWPWAASDVGVLSEAFPAAQLKHWGLPYQGYAAPQEDRVRQVILAGLKRRIRIDAAQANLVVSIPDALDAVLASFASIAIGSGEVVGFKEPLLDGFIAIAD